jgi:hypothetical protein
VAIERDAVRLATVRNVEESMIGFVEVYWLFI